MTNKFLHSSKVVLYDYNINTTLFQQILKIIYTIQMGKIISRKR